MLAYVPMQLKYCMGPEAESFVACCEKPNFVSYFLARFLRENSESKDRLTTHIRFFPTVLSHLVPWRWSANY